MRRGAARVTVVVVAGLAVPQVFAASEPVSGGVPRPPSATGAASATFETLSARAALAAPPVATLTWPARTHGTAARRPPQAHAPQLRFSMLLMDAPGTPSSLTAFPSVLWRPLAAPLLMPLSLRWLGDQERVVDWIAARTGEALEPSRPLTERERSEREAELRWRLRHKSRSVLEYRGAGVGSTDSGALERLMPWLPDMVATVEYVATPPPSGDGEMSVARVMALQGELPRGGRWVVRGFVQPSESARWRTVTETTIGPFHGHEITATTAWANRPFILRPSAATSEVPEEALEGVVLIKDRWRLAKSLALSLGARYSYVGFAADSHHVDPVTALEWLPSKTTTVRVALSARTLVPGGGSLSLSPLDPVVPASVSARLGRAWRSEIAAERHLGGTRLAARAFVEEVRNPFVNVLLEPFGIEARTIPLGERMIVRGVGTSVSRRVGSVLEGTLSYSLGHVYRPPASRAEWESSAAEMLFVPQGTYHDLVGRMTMSIEPTETRVSAFSRLVTANGGHRFLYEVQLRQVVPFVERPTGTEWTVVVAMRNLPWETQEDDALGGIADANPPRRVVGGVSVRF